MKILNIIGKIIRNRRELKYVLVSVLLLCCLLYQGYQAHHHKKRLWSFELTDVSIKCFDHDSRESLPIGLTTSGISYENPLPKIMTTVDRPHSIRLTIAHDKDVDIKVSSKGYEEKNLTITNESDYIEVYLKKLDGTN